MNDVHKQISEFSQQQNYPVWVYHLMVSLRERKAINLGHSFYSGTA